MSLWFSDGKKGLLCKFANLPLTKWQTKIEGEFRPFVNFKALAKRMSEQDTIHELKQKISEKETSISEKTKELSTYVIENGKLNVEIQAQSLDIQSMVRQISQLDEENERYRTERIPRMADTVVDIEIHTKQVWERMNALAQTPPKVLRFSVLPEVKKSKHYDLLAVATISVFNIAGFLVFSLL